MNEFAGRLRENRVMNEPIKLIQNVIFILITIIVIIIIIVVVVVVVTTCTAGA